MSRSSPLTTTRATETFVASGVVFAMLDALVHGLVENAPVLVVMLGRTIVFLALVIVIGGRRHPRRLLVSAQPRLQLARGALLFGSTTMFFAALAVMPLGPVTALGSSSPLIVVVLAGPLLGEHVSGRALLGVLIGFTGVVVLAGFEAGQLDARVLLPIGMSILYAGFQLLSRLVRDDDEAVTLFWTGSVGLALTAVTMLVVRPAEPVGPEVWAVAGLIGVGSVIAHRLLVTAYRYAPASRLAPFSYLGVVWSFVIGAIAFGEPIELRAVIGAALIVAGGLIAHRSAVTPPDAVDPVTLLPDTEPSPTT